MLKPVNTMALIKVTATTVSTINVKVGLHNEIPKPMAVIMTKQATIGLVTLNLL